MSSQNPPSYDSPQESSNTSQSQPQAPPPSYTSTLPSITPVDPSYRSHSTFSLILHALLSAIILNSPLPSSLVFYRVIATWVATIGTFSLLTGRYITLQRACALRLVLTKAEFEATLAHRTVLSQGGMSTIFRLLVATSLLSNLPLVYIGLTKGNGAEWVRRVEGPVGWWFAVVNVVICAVCWSMVMTQDRMKVDFEQEVEVEEIPLKRIQVKEQEEWKRVAGTSRRRDIWVKSFGKQDAGQVFECTTRLASNHPLCNTSTDTKPSGPVLRITLP